MEKKRVLAALLKERGFTLAQLAAECREHPGGEGIGKTTVNAYLKGERPIGDVHFTIMCKCLRIDPESVYTSRYLAGSRREPVAGS